MNKTCIYYHGLGGEASDIITWMFSKFGGFTTVISETIDFEHEWELDKGKSLFERELPKLKNADLVVGLSFGGYLAYKMSKATGVDLLLINPAVNRNRTKTNIGHFNIPKKFNLKSNIEVFFGAEDVQVPREYAIEFFNKTQEEYVEHIVPGMEHSISLWDLKYILETSNLVNKPEILEEIKEEKTT